MQDPFNFGNLQNSMMNGSGGETQLAVYPNNGQFVKKFHRKGDALIYKNGSFLKDAPSYEDGVKEARKIAKAAKPAVLFKEPVRDQRNDVEEFIDDVEDRYEDRAQDVQERGGFWSLGPV